MIGNHIKGVKGAAVCVSTARRPLAVAVAVGLLMGLGVPAAQAAPNDDWTGAVSTDWAEQGNWRGGAAPAAGSVVDIDTTTPHATVLASPGAALGELIVGDQADGSLTLSSGGSLAVSGSGLYSAAMVVGQAKGSQGVVAVTGQGATLNVDGGVQVGSAGQGSLSVTSGGTANFELTSDSYEVLVGYGYYGQAPDAVNGSGSIVVDGAGSTMNYAGGMNVMNGSLTVSHGGALTSQPRSQFGWVDVLGLGSAASAPGSVSPTQALDGTGEATITGAGSSWLSANSLQVGYGGSGKLSVEDGAAASFSGEVAVGIRAETYDTTFDPGTGSSTSVLTGVKAGTGVVNVSGEGSTLAVIGGSLLGDGSLVIGDTSEGTLSVGDKGHVDAASWLAVGNQSVGTLTIDGGGTLVAHADATFGNAAGSAGTVTVDGPDSMLDIAGQTRVGLSGEGTLSVTGGGTADLALEQTYAEVLVGFGTYGQSPDEAGGHGSVIVDGAGSTINYAGGLNLMNGSLTVSDGGHLVSRSRNDSAYGWLDLIGFGQAANSSDSLTRAYALDGTGEATITGAGSSWTSVNQLSIGYGGSGKLSVLDGAAARFSGAVQVGFRVSTFNDTLDPGTNQVTTTTAGTRDGSGVLLVSGQGSTLVVAPEAGISDGDLVIGQTSVGTLSVDDKGSVDAAGRLTVGDQAQGTVTLTGGGSLAAHGSDGNGAGITLGNGVGTKGDLTVSGAGSSLTIDAGAQIGNFGSGSLTVEQGGKASVGLTMPYSEIVAGLGYYGVGGTLAAKGTGAVTVDGAGSTLDYAGGMNMLNGSLTVSHGGKLASRVRSGDQGDTWLDVVGYGLPADDDIAFPQLIGVATATVSGAGSTWSSVNTLDVGNGGTGTLNVLDGGKASFAGGGYVGDSAYLYVNGQLSALKQAGKGTVNVSGNGSLLSIGAPAGSTGTRLYVGSRGEGVVTVSDGGTLKVDGGIEVGAQGRLTVGGRGAGGNVLAPGAIDTPALRLAASSQPHALVFDHAATEDGKYVLATRISGSGGIGVSAGFTELTGDSSAYAGHVDVDGGTLSVNGSLGGDIHVAPAGRLQGTGTVNDVVVAGTLAPGNSPGTLHVKGDLVMQAGSVYEAQIDPATGKSDSVEVAGNVTIQPGTTLAVQSLSEQPLTPGAQINLFQSTGNGTVQGQFDNTEGSVSDFLGYGVTYRDGQVVVDVKRSSTSFASVGGTSQGQALGAALDGVTPGSALGTLLYGQLTGADQAAQAFKGMAGTLHADVRRVMLDDSRQVRDAVAQRLQQDAEGDGAAWWVRALGQWSQADGAEGFAEAKSDSSGAMVGVDTGVGDNSRLGVAAGLGQTSYRMGAQDSAHLKDRHLVFYGSSLLGRLDLGYGLASTWHRIDTHRAFAVGAVPQRLNGNADARADQLFVDAGYRFGDDARRYAEPYVALAHVRLHGDAVHEHGDVTALDVASDTEQATFGTLGLRWAAQTDVVRWYGTLGWRHVFGFDRPSVQARFAGEGAAFAVQGLPMARDAAQVELGASFTIGKRAHMSFGYDGLVAGDAASHGARAQLVVDF